MRNELLMQKPVSHVKLCQKWFIPLPEERDKLPFTQLWGGVAAGEGEIGIFMVLDSPGQIPGFPLLTGDFVFYAPGFPVETAFQ